LRLYKITGGGVVEKHHVLGLFKYPKGHTNVQMQGNPPPKGGNQQINSPAVEIP
jgi:hypothetical protein